MLKFRTWQGMLLGFGLGLAGGLLFPKLKDRRLAVIAGSVTRVVRGGIGQVQGNVKKWTDAAKDEAQDLFAEAQYERMRKEIDKEIAADTTHFETEEKLPLS